MPDSNVAHDELLREFGGRDKNDLNKILKNSQHDSENPISLRSFSPYMYYDDLKNYLRNNINGFSVLSLNIQNIFSKFDTFYPVIKKLNGENLFFSAICLQECWLDENDVTSIIQLPDYRFIQQSKICCGHGGLIIYLHNTLSYELRNIYTRYDTWEGLFIDITSDNFVNKITLGNIYIPPKDNNNNTNIETFINELAPLINRFGKEKTTNIIVGDFNSLMWTC